MFLKIVNLLESRDVSICFKFLLMLVFVNVKNTDVKLVNMWRPKDSKCEHISTHCGDPESQLFSLPD